MPGKASLTMAVPAAVPSDFHSSKPWGPSLAEKNRVLPTAVRLRGQELVEPGLRSEIMAVPAGVPSLRHSSSPWVASVALKYNAPFIATGGEVIVAAKSMGVRDRRVRPSRDSTPSRDRGSVLPRLRIVAEGRRLGSMNMGVLSI